MTEREFNQLYGNFKKSDLVNLVRDRGIRPSVNTSNELYHYCKDLAGKKREHFVVLCINSRNKVIARKTMFIGTLDTVTFHCREVFKYAIEQSACKVAIVHNHPSEEPEPSEADISVTKKVMKAGEILGIELADSLIISDDKGTMKSYFSFKERGYF